MRGYCFAVPLFGPSKPTATVSQYARWFHTFDADSTIAPGIDHEMLRSAYVQGIINVVAERDARFARTDLQAFIAEYIAIRAELFGLAWGHTFSGRDNHLLGEGMVAKEVLTEMGVWDRTPKYNSASARSSEETLPKGERTRRAAVVFQNSWRTSMVENWGKLGIDMDVIVQVVNRAFTQESWKSGATLRYLAAELLVALGFADAASGEIDLNEAALEALAVPLFDIYTNSRSNFANYNIKAD